MRNGLCGSPGLPCALEVKGRDKEELAALPAVREPVVESCFQEKVRPFPQADHPQVLDGASDFLVAALGDAGRHVRSVLGASSLRSRTAVVLDAIFEIKT